MNHYMKFMIAIAISLVSMSLYANQNHTLTINNQSDETVIARFFTKSGMCEAIEVGHNTKHSINNPCGASFWVVEIFPADKNQVYGYFCPDLKTEASIIKIDSYRQALPGNNIRDCQMS